MKCMNSIESPKKRRVCVPGAVVVGAGPSGLAAAACLKVLGVPSVVLERSKCLASLWHLKTYDRLRLHLPKQFCELPHMPFPSHYPTYPTKQQFIDYLESYALRFGISPTFAETVTSAQFDPTIDLWRVQTTGAAAGEIRETEYVTRWLVVATGENSEPYLPELDGRDLFAGTVEHTSSYKSGERYDGKNVLVVGCGNSGMEVCLDLCNYNAHPSIVVRDSVHILPREIIWISTFGLSMWLLKWIPLTIVDQILLALSWLFIGDTRRYGLRRPKMGPLLQKNLTGKTPVLDVGAMDLIRTGRVKVCPAIRQLRARSVEFVDGRVENFEAIVLATGYKSNVSSWLKEEMFCEDGYPRRAFPEGWKGENGLYAVGFTRRGLLGAGMDAMRVAEDIERFWKVKAKHLTALARLGLPLSS